MIDVKILDYALEAIGANNYDDYSVDARQLSEAYETITKAYQQGYEDGYSEGMERGYIRGMQSYGPTEADVVAIADKLMDEDTPAKVNAQVEGVEFAQFFHEGDTGDEDHGC